MKRWGEKNIYSFETDMGVNGRKIGDIYKEK